MIINKLEANIYYFTDIINNAELFLNNIKALDEFCSNYTNITKWTTWTASTDINYIYGLSKDGTFTKKHYMSQKDLEIYEVSKIIKDASDFAISAYCKDLGIPQPWLPDFFSIKMYNEGVDMGPHVDSSDPTDFHHPVLSGVMYLNDDYEGGEINFPNQKIKIKPKSGSLIVFPSIEPYIHHPQKITSGNKYMVPLFWYKEAF